MSDSLQFIGIVFGSVVAVYFGIGVVWVILCQVIFQRAYFVSLVDRVQKARKGLSREYFGNSELKGAYGDLSSMMSECCVDIEDTILCHNDWWNRCSIFERCLSFLFDIRIWPRYALAAVGIGRYVRSLECLAAEHNKTASCLQKVLKRREAYDSLFQEVDGLLQKISNKDEFESSLDKCLKKTLYLLQETSNKDEKVH